MSISLSRRFGLLLVPIVVSFAIFKCGSFRSAYVSDDFCRAGNGSPSKPMICVDETTLTANPHHAPVYDVEAKNHKPTNRAVTIHWFSRRTADLQITMKDDSCAEPVKCDGAGHCWTKVKKLPDNKERVCTYSMTLGSTKYDPDDDIILTPCCW